MDHSPLIKLPPEVRNAIYEYVLHDPRQEGVIISARGPKPTTIHRQSMALTQVCRQLSEEATPMFFSINKFTVKAKYLERAADRRLSRNCGHALDTCRAWLSSIGPSNVKLLSSVTVDLGVYHEARSRAVLRRMIEGIKAEIRQLPLPAHALSVSFAFACPFYQMQYVEIPTCNQSTMLKALSTATRKANLESTRNWDVIYLGHFERAISMMAMA